MLRLPNPLISLEFITLPRKYKRVNICRKFH